MQAKVAESEARAQSAEMKLAEMERRLAIAEASQCMLQKHVEIWKHQSVCMQGPQHSLHETNFYLEF